LALLRDKVACVWDATGEDLRRNLMRKSANTRGENVHD
jgi:hypothetical protein